MTPSFEPLDANEPDGAAADSWYEATAASRAPPTPLNGDRRVDVCIVGGGYTGLSAALRLAELGADVALLEARRSGWGASGRNGGQVGSGQRLDVFELEKLFGIEAAKQLWGLGEAAKQLVFDLVAQHDIPCDLQPRVLHAHHRRGMGPAAEAYAQRLRRIYGYDAIEPLSREALRTRLDAPGYYGGYEDHGAGHLHPLNFALGLARAAHRAGAQIFEETRVLDIAPGPPARLRCAQGVVTADAVILGANGYLGKLAPATTDPVRRRVAPINNFIVATEPLGARAQALLPNRAAAADSRFVVNYFRLSADNRLLFGGGESYGMRFPKDIRGVVRPRMLQVFPQLADVRLDYAWGGALAITMNRLPHAARLAPHILSAGGYSGHGVALSTLAGRAMAEALRLPSGSEAFEALTRTDPRPFPGGAQSRQPLLTLAMLWYSLLDRL